MNREPLMSLQVVSRTYRALLSLVALLALAACSGGASTQVNQVATAPGNGAQNYTGPAPAKSRKSKDDDDDLGDVADILRRHGIT